MTRCAQVYSVFSTVQWLHSTRCLTVLSRHKRCAKLFSVTYLCIGCRTNHWAKRPRSCSVRTLNPSGWGMRRWGGDGSSSYPCGQAVWYGCQRLILFGRNGRYGLLLLQSMRMLCVHVCMCVCVCEREREEGEEGVWELEIRGLWVEIWAVSKIILPDITAIKKQATV